MSLVARKRRKLRRHPPVITEAEHRLPLQGDAAALRPHSGGACGGEEGGRLNDETLKRRAEIIRELYEASLSGRPVGGWLITDAEPLIASGALIRSGNSIELSEAALAAMDLGVRTAAGCVVSKGAMPITNLAAENARLKDLVRHVQSQPDGLRSCRVELFDARPKEGKGTMVVTMPAGDERAMVDRIGEWLSGQGVYHSETGQRLELAEHWAEALGACAWELKATLESIRDNLDRCDDGEAERLCKAVLAHFAKVPEIVECMSRMHALHRRRAAPTPPDWPHITLADCAAWAEAIVVALETSDDWILEEVYEDALCCWRALARGASATGMLLDSQRRLAREATHADRYDIARAYSAIIAVRMLAAEAAKREQT